MTKTWLQSEINYRKNLNVDDFALISRTEAKSKNLQLARCEFIIRACTMDLVKITLLNGRVIETNLQNLQQFEDDSDEWQSVWCAWDDKSDSTFYFYERAIASIEFSCSTEEDIESKIKLAKELGVYED